LDKQAQIGDATLYLGDCRDILQKIPDNSIDLVVTSPPYDDLREYHKSIWNMAVFYEIATILTVKVKEGGVIVWVVGDSVKQGSETGNSFRQALFFLHCGMRLHDTMIYKKSGLNHPDAYRYYQSFEYMFVFTKGKIKTFNPIADRINKYPGIRYMGTRRRNGSLKKELGQVKDVGRRYNVWEYATGFNTSSKDKIAFEHPAIFPEKMAEDHIISWSNPGDLVCDPFLGSGTTGKMALKQSRKCIGIEISDRYFAIACNRIGVYQKYLHENREGIGCGI
jgi:site-specific DNA-methyltransferase (adenine-specific)